MTNACDQLLTKCTRANGKRPIPAFLAEEFLRSSGVPKKFYMDNGSANSSRQFSRLVRDLVVTTKGRA